MRQKIAVLGAGSWGTTIANLLAIKGHEVTLWARRREVADEINHFHRNKRYLKDNSLSASIYAETDLAKAVYQKSVVFFVLPSQSIREIAKQVCSLLADDSLIVHASKGFETESLKRISTVLEEELPAPLGSRVVALSGPSHAEEVIQQKPTTVVVASDNQRAAEMAQSILISSTFRVYTNPDMIGVEVGGALKNIIAIATGLSSGLGFGDNAKAALATRGLAEIARLGLEMGAQPITFVGLAGVGDLMATCTSKHSRNWRAGYMLSQGKNLKQILAEMGMVVEGVQTTRNAFTLSKEYQVEMPITHQLYEVLFDGKKANVAVKDLMSRGKTRELDMLEGW